MDSLVDLFSKNMGTSVPGLGYQMIAFLVANSLFLGVLLAIITYFSSTYLLSGVVGEKRQRVKAQLINGSANILFLCVGLTGVMILVQNNLARAFAIGAALALVRFRVKLGQKSVGSNLLFGIIAGIACGLNELAVAYILTILYFFLQGGLLFVLTRVSAKAALSEAMIDYSELDLSKNDLLENSLPKKQNAQENKGQPTH